MLSALQPRRPEAGVRRCCKPLPPRIVPNAQPSRKATPNAPAGGKVFDCDVEEEFSDVDIQTAPTRRWSTLSSKRFIYQPGTILGSSGLIAGLTIGAGILALPKTTQVRGAHASLQLAACSLVCWRLNIAQLQETVCVGTQLPAAPACCCCLSTAGLQHQVAPHLCSEVACMQEAGFIPSVITLAIFYVFSALTGLMVLEVNANTVCEQGAGAVSMQVRALRATHATPLAHMCAAQMQDAQLVLDLQIHSQHKRCLRAMLAVYQPRHQT